MPKTLTFSPDPHALDAATTLLLIGRKERLERDDVFQRIQGLSKRTWEILLKRTEAKDAARSASTHTDGPHEKIVLGVLPESCSRHNAPSRAWAIPSLVKAGGTRGKLGIVLYPDQPEHAFAMALAVARALPSWSATSKPESQEITVVIIGPDGQPLTDVRPLNVATHGVRVAAQLVDLPPDQLTPTRFVQSAQALAERHPQVKLKVISGEDLAAAGLHGIWGVGKASQFPPALVVLAYDGGQGDPVCWVGKGITYDTGGLSIKSRAGMVGMKTDMGGAAAVFAAFEAAVSLKAPARITAILCIAENAVGPTALRPDDVLTLFSGRTVEINNTDAEGRLVLADGVAWAAKNRAPHTIVDLATLTGAQAVSTGLRTAALYCNEEELEHRAIRAGLASGELVHPLPYVPEWFKVEFNSQVADMRNSVKSRNNAQSSCAGQFIGTHLEATGFQGPWLHVDLAGPATSGGRGTGFGVGLLLTLAGVGAPLS